MRLTVVTTFGLIGTVTTGFLGMNIFAWSEQPIDWRIAAFATVLATTCVLTLYTVLKSRRLSRAARRHIRRAGGLARQAARAAWHLVRALIGSRCAMSVLARVLDDGAFEAIGTPGRDQRSSIANSPKRAGT